MAIATSAIARRSHPSGTSQERGQRDRKRHAFDGECSQHALRPHRACNDETRVDAAECELVAHHPRQLRRTRLTHHVVERRAAVIDDLEVAGRRDPALAQHRDRERELERAARTERVAEVAFERAHRHAVAEHFVRRLALGDVADGRCRSRER